MNAARRLGDSDAVGKYGPHGSASPSQAGRGTTLPEVLGPLVLVVLITLPGCSPDEPQLDPVVIEGIRLAMADDDEQVRRLAYEELAKLNVPRLRLRSLLEPGDLQRIADDLSAESGLPVLGAAALGAYAKLGPPDRRPLRRVLEMARLDQPIREAALRALAAVSDREAEGAILEGLGYDDPTVRIAALQAARSLSREQSLTFVRQETLLDLLEDPHPRVREQAVASLEDLGRDREAGRLYEAVLERLRYQSDPAVCVSLLSALAHLEHSDDPDIIDLAKSCAGLGADTEGDRSVWSQALRTVDALSGLSAGALLYSLSRPDRFDPATVLELSSAEPSHYSLLTAVQLLEKTEDEQDPDGEVRRIALKHLTDGAENFGSYLPLLLEMAAMRPAVDVDVVLEPLVDAFWTDPDAARNYLHEKESRVSALLGDSSPIVQTRIIGIVGRDEITALEYSAPLWAKLEELDFRGSSRMSKDHQGTVRAAIIKAIGSTGHDEPYLNDMAKLLQLEANADPFGLVRLAAVGVLSSTKVRSIYVEDLIRLLRRLWSSGLHTSLRNELFETLMGRQLQPRQLALIMNPLYEAQGQNAQNRFLALFFGAASPENRYLLAIARLLEERSPTGLSPTDAARLLADLVTFEDLHRRFRTHLATELALLGLATAWECRDRPLLERCSARLTLSSFPREARALEHALGRLSESHCAQQAMRSGLIDLLRGLLVLLVFYLLLKGFRR